MAKVIWEAVLIGTAGVRKYHLRISAPHMLVKWLVHFRDRTPSVQGATGLPRICTERTADATRPPLVTCIYPYSGIQKCRLCISAPYTFVKSLVHFWNRTPTVQGTIGLPRMCTEPMVQDVYRADD